MVIVPTLQIEVVLEIPELSFMYFLLITAPWMILNKKTGSYELASRIGDALKVISFDLGPSIVSRMYCRIEDNDHGNHPQT
jgi:hypothetical protein